VDDVRIGRILRALRRERHLRQQDIAAASSVAQTTVSLIERGHLDRLSQKTIRAVFAAVEARFEGSVSWRGGAIDRLLDERHSLLVGAVADRLRDQDWVVEVEATYSVFGERGSMDLLAFHPGAGMVLVVEVKTELTSIEETVRRHDAKERLARGVALERFGWSSSSTSRLLVVLDSATGRRRVQRHDDVLRVAYPDRGTRVRTWLRRPDRRIRGLLFLSPSNHRAAGRQSRAHAVAGPP
jgi:transcriptional regulator with XRE-family HTH domain